MSPDRICDIARRRIKPGPVGGIKWGACELSTDDMVALPFHQLRDLS